VVVGVNQAGQDDVAAQVEGLIGVLGQFIWWANLLDEAISNKKTTTGNLPAVAVKGYQQVSIFDQ
jgi:hypothetical protein